MGKILLFLAAVGGLAMPAVACGQSNESRDPRLVQPERPTVATHAGTVARGWLELEEGAEWDKAADGTRTFIAPTNLKIGLTTNAQVNVLFNLIYASALSGGDFAIGDLALGVKYRIVEGHWLLGDFALLPAVKFATATASEAGTGTTDVSLLLISSRQVGHVAVDLNVGRTRRGGDGSSAPRDAAIWTASFGFPITGPLGATVELYGYPSTSGPAGSDGTAALLVGPTYLARKWLSLDAGIIVPLPVPSPARSTPVSCGTWAASPEGSASEARTPRSDPRRFRCYLKTSRHWQESTEDYSLGSRSKRASFFDQRWVL